MALDLIEPTNFTKTSNRNPLIGRNYELELKQSIQSVLSEIREGNIDLSRFTSTFFELILARVDAPLESIWFYAGLSFRSRNVPEDNHLEKIAAARDLFQLLSACSASCSSSKSISLLAPVLFLLYGAIAELCGKDIASKKDKKAMREVTSLVEVILGYINLCCKNSGEEDDDLVNSNLIVPLGDLVSVWMDSDKGLGSFLPLASSEVCRGLSLGECDVVHLAGVVMAEAFCMKMCLIFRTGISRKLEQQKELKNWAVCSVSGFRNFYFFGTLLRMMLEDSLPVTSLLSSEDEVLLRKVLYDAIVLVDYSFLNPEKLINMPPEHMKCLAINRLVVTHEAIKLSRDHGDQKRATAYTNAFSSSPLPSQIVKWVASQVSVEENEIQSSRSSPKTLIKWLLNLENQGLRVFDDVITRSRAKLALDVSQSDQKQPALKFESKQVNDNMDLFYIDNKGEDDKDENEKTNLSTSDVFAAAADIKKTPENGQRKRKEEGESGKKKKKKKKIKFVKYDLAQNSSLSKSTGNSNEVEDPVSDEDNEE